MGLVKKETPRHIKAFEYYYSLGDKRSIGKVARRFKVSYQGARKWGVSFNWQLRIAERDSKFRAEIEKASDETIEEMKKKHIKDINTTLRVVNMGMETATREMLLAWETKGKEGLKCKTVSEFSGLVRSFTELLKTKFLLLGEIKEGGIENLTFAQISKNINIELNAIVGNGTGNEALKNLLIKELKNIGDGK